MLSLQSCYDRIVSKPTNFDAGFSLFQDLSCVQLLGMKHSSTHVSYSKYSARLTHFTQLCGRNNNSQYSDHLALIQVITQVYTGRV